MKKKFILGMLIILGGLLGITMHSYAATYDVSTADALIAIQTSSSRNYSGDTINLLNDIDLTGKTFTPIGSASYPFAGTFNGNGHSIKGLNINSTNDYQGLFGKISSTATVKNVTVYGNVKGGNYTAGIVGYNLGTIDSCINNCQVTGSYNYIGGIVGSNEGMVKNTRNSGTIMSSGTTARVGGIAGSNAISGARIMYSYNIGEVHNTYNDNLKGGVVGENNGTLTNTFYLSGTANKGIYNKDDVSGAVQSKSSADLQLTTIINSLNSSQSPKVWGMNNDINNGYPILIWENASSDRESKKFITTWSIPTANITIKLPVREATYYAVEWGDGSISTYTTDTYPTHTYTSAGTYDIKISGKVTYFGCDTTGTVDESSNSKFLSFVQYLIGVKQLGEIGTHNYQFSKCSNLTTFIANPTSKTFENFDDMRSMFFGCEGLTSLDLSSFDTSRVTRMTNAFDRCTKLESINISNFNTSIVNDMSYMFRYCEKLGTITFGSDFITSSVTQMQEMFRGCTNLTSVDLSGFDTKNVKNMYALFRDCNNLTSVNVSSFNTADVENMAFMFYNCSSLGDVDVSRFNTAKVTAMQQMFQNTAISKLDLSSFNTVKAPNMNYMFDTMPNLESLVLGKNFTKYNGNWMMGGTTKNVKAIIVKSNSVIEIGSNGIGGGGSNAVLYVLNESLETQYESTYSSILTSSKVEPITKLIGNDSISANVSATYTDGGIKIAGINVTPNSDGTITTPTLLSQYGYTLSVTNAKIENPVVGQTYTVTYNLKYYDNNSVEDTSLARTLTRQVTIVKPTLNLMQRESYSDTDTWYALGVKRDNRDVLKNNYTADKIEKIVIQESLQGMDSSLHSWDVSSSKNGSIMAWTKAGSSTGKYILYIGGYGTIKMNTSAGRLFENYINCGDIQGLELLDTSGVNTFVSCFRNDAMLTGLNLSNFDTSTATNFNSMFEGCTNLKSIDLSSFNSTNVNDMTTMFSKCSSLKEIDLSPLDMSGVKYMSWMLQGCTNLERVTFGENLDTSNVESMPQLFHNCEKLTSIDVSKFTTNKVTNMYGMFQGCSSLTSIDVSNFVTNNVEDMRYMFMGCSSLSRLDVSNFNTSKVKRMTQMFSHLNLTNLDLTNFNTSKLENMDGLFSDSSNLQYIILGSEFTKFDGGWMLNGNNLRAIISKYNGVMSIGSNGLNWASNAVLYVPTKELESQYESTYSSVLTAAKVETILKLNGDPITNVNVGEEYTDAGAVLFGNTSLINSNNYTADKYGFRAIGGGYLNGVTEINKEYTVTYRLVKIEDGSEVTRITRSVRTPATVNYEVGGRGYLTLEEACNSITSSDKTTIKLIRNTDDNSSAIIANNRDIILDLGDNTLTLTSASITNNGTFEIKGTGTITSSVNKTIVNNKTMTINDNVTISNTGSNVTIENGSAGILNIKDGLITAIRNHAIANTGTVNMSGGKISINTNYTSDVYGINNIGGIINISGTSEIDVRNSNSQGRGLNGNGTINITSGKINGSQYGICSSGTVNIYDGEISGSYAVWSASEATETNVITITGGKINGTNVGVYNNGGGSIIIGNNLDGKVSKNTPVVSSEVYAYGQANSANGSISIYDGIFTGGTKAIQIDNTSIEPVTPTGYGIRYEDNNKIAYVDDITKPTVSISTSTTTDTVGPVTLTGTAQDTLAGVVGTAWTKVNTEPTSWNLFEATTSSVTQAYIVNQNGTYYFWAKDARDNVSSTSYIVSCIKDANYEVNGEKFLTLSKAYQAINTTSQTTIKVLKNVEDASSVTIANNRNIVLDLQSYTLTLTSASLTNSGTLELVGTGTITATNKNTIVNSGTLKIERDATKVTNTRTSGTVYAISNSGTFINTTGEITSNYRAILLGNGSITMNGGTVACSAGDVAIRITRGIFNLTDGTITGKQYAMYNDSSNDTQINITGGSITATQIGIYSNSDKTKINMSAGEINVNINSASDYAYGIEIFKSELNISGDAKITVNNSGTAQSRGVLIGNDGTGNITGGTITAKTYGVISEGKNTSVNISGGRIESTGESAIIDASSNDSTCVTTITGGTIIGNNRGIWHNGGGKIIVGTNDGTISKSNPSISGANGYYKPSTSTGTFEFYDGRFTGTTKAIIIENTSIKPTIPTGTKIVYENNEKIAYLDLEKPMITEWNIPSANTTIKLPIPESSRNDYTVDWGDGIVEHFKGSTATFPVHTYTTSGVKKIKVSGVVNEFGYADSAVPASSSNYYTYTQYLIGVKALGELTATKYGFARCTKLVEFTANATELTFDRVTSMNAMFYGDTGLTELDLSTFDTSHVTSMGMMFDSCNKLEKVDLSSFDTSNVTSMNQMFCGASKLESIKFGTINTSNVTSFARMFDSCGKLEEVDLSNFDTSKATSMYLMFRGCGSLQSLDLSSFDTNKVTNMNEMLNGCSKLKTLLLGSNFDKLKGTSMFASTSALESVITQRTTPMELGDSLGVGSGTTLYVPNVGVVNTFKNANKYSDTFGTRIKPILELRGEGSLDILQNSTYVDEGIKVAGFNNLEPDGDSNLAPNEVKQYGYKLTVKSTVDTNTVTDTPYTVTYKLTYKGAEVMSVVRSVRVIPALVRKPVITVTNIDGKVIDSGNWSNKDVNINISTDEYGTAFKYSYDQVKWYDYSGDISYTNNTKSTTIYAKAYNTFINTQESAVVSHEIKIDKDAPTAGSIELDGVQDASSGKIKVIANNFADDVSAIYSYTWEYKKVGDSSFTTGETYVTSSSESRFEFNAESYGNKYVVKLTVVDNAGNSVVIFDEDNTFELPKTIVENNPVVTFINTQKTEKTRINAKIIVKSATTLNSVNVNGTQISLSTAIQTKVEDEYNYEIPYEITKNGVYTATAIDTNGKSGSGSVSISSFTTVNVEYEIVKGDGYADVVFTSNVAVKVLQTNPSTYASSVTGDSGEYSTVNRLRVTEDSFSCVFKFVDANKNESSEITVTIDNVTGKGTVIRTVENKTGNSFVAFTTMGIDKAYALAQKMEFEKTKVSGVEYDYYGVNAGQVDMFLSRGRDVGAALYLMSATKVNTYTGKMLSELSGNPQANASKYGLQDIGTRKEYLAAYLGSPSENSLTKASDEYKDEIQTISLYKGLDLRGISGTGFITKTSSGYEVNSGAESANTSFRVTLINR